MNAQTQLFFSILYWKSCNMYHASTHIFQVNNFMSYTTAVKSYIFFSANLFCKRSVTFLVWKFLHLQGSSFQIIETQFTSFRILLIFTTYKKLLLNCYSQIWDSFYGQLQTCIFSPRSFVIKLDSSTRRLGTNHFFYRSGTIQYFGPLDSQYAT